MERREGEQRAYVAEREENSGASWGNWWEFD